MSYLRSIKVKNGNHYEPAHYYQCDNCKKELFEADFDYDDGQGYDLCRDCAFILNKFTEREYLNSRGIGLKTFHAVVHKGEIIIWQGKPIPPFQRSNKRQRHLPQYIIWRIEVFQRDNYTCLDCGQKGGNINAHHLKEYAKFPELRFNIENGVTLCELCHKKKHKRVV